MFHEAWVWQNPLCASHDSFSTIRYIPELLEPHVSASCNPWGHVTAPFVKTHKGSLVLVAWSRKFICVMLVALGFSLSSLKAALWWKWISLLRWWFSLEDQARVRILTSLRPGSMTTFPASVIYNAQSDSPFIVYSSRAIETAVVRNKSALCSDLARSFFNLLQ